VIVVPDVFAIPAGLSAIASPLSVDATAAPARDVEIAPEPGRYKPPATAMPPEQTVAIPITVAPLIMAARLPRNALHSPVLGGLASRRWE
jgi:hypothetical protein